MKGAAAALTFSPVTVTVVPPLYENKRRTLAPRTSENTTNAMIYTCLKEAEGNRLFQGALFIQPIHNKIG